MASQRVTIAKIGGMAADAAGRLLNEFVNARTTTDPNEWSSDQWPSKTRVRADEFADQLRLHGGSPSVIHFVEWWDLWSMGDVFRRWLTPPRGDGPLYCCHGDRFEVYGYVLPDDGHLARHLAGAGPQQSPEYEWFVARLLEAVKAWEGMEIDRSVLVMLREVFGGLVTDDELMDSMSIVPEWLAERQLETWGSLT